MLDRVLNTPMESVGIDKYNDQIKYFTQCNLLVTFTYFA